MSGHDEEPDYEMEMKRQFDVLRSQRDALLVAAKALIKAIDDSDDVSPCECGRERVDLESAIAKTESAP